MDKNKVQTIALILGAVIIVAAIIFLVFPNKPSDNLPGTTVSPSPEAESVQDTSDQNGNVPASVISYADALVKYATRRIQLDTDCRAYPNNITYKDNTGIMIDNRSPKTRTVKVGTTFTIKPWSFKVIVLPDVYLKSKTLLVDCDGYQNVATILIQE